METASMIRLYSFIGLLLALVAAEYMTPWRDRAIKRSDRWLQNLTLTAVNTALSRFTVGGIPLLVSFYCFENRVGLLQMANLPATAAIICSYLLLDLMIYAQHIIFHRVSWLWRLHQVHHTDRDLDVTSGFRFHPLEILASLLIKSCGIAILGPHPMGVVLFEILLNAGSLFNHSNIRIPERWEPWLRSIIVTPKVHVIHHSTKPRETDSNFGFTISVWDRLFGTYVAKEDAQGFAIGLDEFPDHRTLTLRALLEIPFRVVPGSRTTRTKEDFDQAS